MKKILKIKWIIVSIVFTLQLFDNSFLGLPFINANIVFAADISEYILIPEDGTSGDYFGRSVSICGDTAIVGAITADESGTWSITTPLVNGTHILTAIASDAVGNISTVSIELFVTIDTLIPTVLLT